MSAFLQSRKAAWLTLAAILALGALIVILAPAERTLGQTIKVVYVHVALSRAGALGFYLAGIVGLVSIFIRDVRFPAWMRAVGWAALSLSAAGFLVSGVAQLASWGGIAWGEPRVETAMNVLAVAVIVQIVNAWLPWPLGRAGLHVMLALFQGWASLRAPGVLHPTDAIGQSTSGAIQATGALLLALALLLGAWIVWQLRLPDAEPDTESA